MGKVKEVITAGLEVLDEAYEAAVVYGDGAKAFYDGCLKMFKVLTPGFDVEVVDGHHELKGV